MPANPNAPFGFKYIGQINGSPANFGMRRGMIITGNTNKIFTGDVLKANASGYLDVAASNATAIGGVAVFFEWVSKAQLKTVRQNWWPGNGDASGDVACYYHADPFALFEVQCLAGPVAQASVGLNININVGSGGQQTGAGNLSSFTADDGNMDSTSTRPFKIYRLPVDSAGPIPLQYATPGYDPSQAFNRLYVTMNNLTS